MSDDYTAISFLNELSKLLDKYGVFFYVEGYDGETIIAQIGDVDYKIGGNFDGISSVVCKQTIMNLTGEVK